MAVTKHEVCAGANASGASAKRKFRNVLFHRDVLGINWITLRIYNKLP